MLRIGDRPEPIVLEIYLSGGTYYDLSSDFGNKTTLVSFVDINNGWSWMNNMAALRTLFPTTDLDLIAVIYDFTGATVTGARINTQLLVDPVDLTNITVLIDPTWSFFAASASYQSGFNNGVDPSFNANTGDYFWSYLVSESFFITDKWHLNTTANGDPISFSRFTLPVGSFDSADFGNTQDYVAQRVTNLLAPPTILSASIPDGSTIDTLTSLEVVFSKPVGTLIPAPPSEVYLDTDSVTATGNYNLGGGGATAPATLAFAGVDPLLYQNASPGTVKSNVGKIENVVFMNFVGNLTNSNGDNDVNVQAPGITDTALSPLTDDTVSFVADVTGPVLNPVHIQSNNAASVHAKIGDTITLSFTTLEDIIAPTVTIAGQAAVVTGGPTVWSATYDMQASDTEGPVAFVISNLEDLMGNPSTDVTAVTDGSSVQFYKPSPTITTAVLEADNSKLTLTFNRPVYSDVGAINPLAAGDFSLNFIQGAGTATDASIASVTHTAGSAVAELNLSITGTPDGLESIEARPVANQIYDSAGNPALDTDTSGVILLFGLPDPFVRDNVDDDGTEPSAGSLSLSPDIIVFRTPAEVANPQADYGGTNPAVVDNYNLGDTAEDGQDNYILVRAYNRGNSIASNVSGMVYYTNFSTALLPGDWTPIGVATFPDPIPNDGVLYVSDPLTWPDALVPTEGHYCLIAIIGCDGDPAPTLAEISAVVVDVPTYLTYIHDVNNITYRNIHVADDILPAPEPPPPAPDMPPLPEPDPGETPDGQDPEGYNALPFQFAGGPQKEGPLPMELQVHLKLPAGSRALLEIPLALLREMQERGKDKLPKVVKIDKKREVAWLLLNPYEMNYLPEMHLAPKTRWPMRLFVLIRKKYIDNRYKAYAIQRNEGREIGRAAWFIGRGWGPQKKPPIIYRFFRAMLDGIFMVKGKPGYKIKY